ncbi:hypothetical protein BST36_10020 [Mycolicibacterium moriokaense]|jgi:hypothetical protein|uniref:Uncharacterized protein n=1 Tax=Mycolicibacterium moriokaense TaxID=39691 RepID=A0AAD1HD29_9MYCO|nr:hypothetical protein [Mycolicibacterium moriokaense]MCV7038438.1 hypothetical protein [Mycolicibacterium moriokaense]ORB24894.1 hypothetical protein BST36_10020 [Mycolicibacterium moriokaense]BBX02439.1 hypothetical protein MMOR_33750 [Mycolicibacterium moriokaense]
MDRNVMIWIVVAVAAIVAIAIVAWAVRNSRRRAEAERLRSEIGQRTEHLEKREAVAEETAAKARAAQAEAEAKAAEAARLENTARAHREAVTSTRDELDAQRERAARLDPKGSTDEPAPGKADDVRTEATAPQQQPSSHERQRS